MDANLRFPLGVKEARMSVFAQTLQSHKKEVPQEDDKGWPVLRNIPATAPDVVLVS